MADNATLTNKKASFDANTNSDIPTRSTERSGNQVQHVILDIGDGVESILSTSNPLPVDGSGSTQPVSGTVTAELSATDNAVLDAIAASLATPTTLIEGEKDVADAATPEALASTTAIKKVDIVAKADNTGVIWVKSSSTQNQQGRPLFAAQGYTVETDDLANIFLEVTVNGEGVTFLAYN